jgi:hypothetical protein
MKERTSKKISLPAFSNIRLHHGNRDSDTFCPGGGIWIVREVCNIMVLVGYRTKEVYLVALDSIPLLPAYFE